MSNETAEQFANWMEPCIHGNVRFFVGEPAPHPLPRNGCIQCLGHYGDLRAKEERERLLAELRSERAEAVLHTHSLPAENAARTYEGKIVITLGRALSAIAIAKQEGKDEAKAELQEVKSLIHRQAHTTPCAVHNSRACDCGRTDNA